MIQKEVASKVPENKEKGQVALGPVTVLVNYAETLEEAKQMYGEEAILSNAFANWKVTIQANIRGGLKRGETAEAMQTRLADSKMGVAATGSQVDIEAAFKAKFLSANPEEQKKMIAELRSDAKG